MSAIVRESPIHERRVNERRRGYRAFPRTDGMKMSWGSVLGGVFVAIGLLVLLTALGVAVGISAAQPGETDAAALGTGAGIWAALSLLLALFIGGMAATRVGAISDGATGFFEGALVWVVSVLLMVYLAASGVAVVAGGAFQLIGGATQAIGTAMQGAGAVEMSGSVDQILARLKDPQTAEQVATATGIPISEVRTSMAEIAQRVDSVRDNPAQAAAEVRQGLAQLYERAASSGALERKAEQIKPAATQAAWLTFGALVLSLLAAVFGAMLGRRRLLNEARVP